MINIQQIRHETLLKTHPIFDKLLILVQLNRVKVNEYSWPGYFFPFLHSHMVAVINKWHTKTRYMRNITLILQHIQVKHSLNVIIAVDHLLLIITRWILQLCWCSLSKMAHSLYIGFQNKEHPEKIGKINKGS